MQLLRQHLPHPEHHAIAVMQAYSDDEIGALASSFNESGKLDILINNAGCSHFALFEQHSFDDIREQIRTNIEIPALLTRALLPDINPGGIILNIGPIFGEIGHPAWSVDSATKAAIHRFSETLGRELQGRGISVLYTVPRATETALSNEDAYALNRKPGNGMDSPGFVAARIIRMLETEQKCCRPGAMERLFVSIRLWKPKKRCVSAR